MKLMRPLFALALTLTLSTAGHCAQKTYLIFESGQDRSTTMWVGETPRADQMSPGSTAVEFVEVNNDHNLSRYKLVNGAIVYEGRPAPAAPVVPPMRQWCDAVFADPTITPEQKAQVMPFFPVMLAFGSQQPERQAGWQMMVLAHGGTWLTEELQAKLRAHAAAVGIPFVEGD